MITAPLLVKDSGVAALRSLIDCGGLDAAICAQRVETLAASDTVLRRGPPQLSRVRAMLQSYVAK